MTLTTKVNLSKMTDPPIKRDAVASLKPDARFSFAGDDIFWHDGNPDNITEEQIATKLAELTTAWENLDWERNRKKEYPDIKELLIALYDTEDREAIDARRAAVKAKYPKP